MTDPVVEEVRAARAKIAEECGYDLARILDHARQASAKIPGLRYGAPPNAGPHSRGNAVTAAPRSADHGAA